MKLLKNEELFLIIPSNTYGFLSLASVLEEIDQRQDLKYNIWRLDFR
jgi:hypothetical protein